MFWFLRKTWLPIVFGLCCVSAYSQQERVLHGKILDANGAAITEAQVKISANSGKISFCAVSEACEFDCKIDFAGDFVLEVRAAGFSILRQSISETQDFSEILEFRLPLLPIREQVVVTANRTATRLGETPASMVILPRESIAQTAAPTVDDALRQVAGFSIFRRSSSRNANPTTQGVSLRGVGASGASRSLVLFDGVALNDPFGGWVQWNRVSAIGVEQVEVLRGGASSLYGGDSLSGAINIIPRAVSKTGSKKYLASAEFSGGTQNTFSGSAFLGFKKDDWTADLTAAGLQTKGYIAVDEAQRGPVDVFSGVRSTNLSARAAKSFGGTAVFFRPSVFGEVRTNGTGLQTNRTHIRQFILGGETELNDHELLRQPKFNWRVYGGTQTYDQIFSAVSADRASENLNRVQRVPVQTFGFSGQFSAFVKGQTFVAGVEGKEVRGASNETAFANGAAASLVGAGGRQRTFGGYIQDLAKIGKKLVLVGSIRYDAWQNYRALSSTLTFSSGQAATAVFPDRSEHAWSPQVSALYQINDNFAVRVSASKSFRAPTLNELYRNFRVGNVLTLANENLRAERADNFETGVIFTHGKTYVRGGFFQTEIDGAVANVTLGVTSSLITRRRQNAGQTRSRGFEFDAETTLRRFHFSAGYLLADSTVTGFPANIALEGLQIPQVPRHQLTLQASYAGKDWTLALQGRASGKQFDDDQNLFRLEPFFQLDVFVAKKLKESLKIFAGIENILNSRYSVGKTPIRTVSSPANLRIGFRWN